MLGAFRLSIRFVRVLRGSLSLVCRTAIVLVGRDIRSLDKQDLIFETAFFRFEFRTPSLPVHYRSNGRVIIHLCCLAERKLREVMDVL
jgi:hypothetical protein